MAYERSAQYYDSIYAALGKDYAAEAAAIRGFIARHKHNGGVALLDVACGTGGHLTFLREWFDAEGVDDNAAMLEIAARRLPGTPLHRADMTDFRLPHRFDAITCLFSAIGHAQPLDRMRAAIATMARHLNLGGVLLVEPWITPDEWRPEGRVDADFVDEPGLKVARINTAAREGDVSILDMHYLVGTPRGIEYFSERFGLGLYAHEQYAAALRDAGLEPSFDPHGLIGRGMHIGVSAP